MRDLRFHYLVDALEVGNIADLGGTPRRIQVEGARLGFVADLRVNGVSSELVVVDNANRVTAVVPSRFQDVPLHLLRVEVLGRTLTGRSEARLVLDFGAQLEAVEGFQLLIQLVLRQLLITPGTNRFAPQEGGGIFALASALYTPATAPRFQTALQSFAAQASASIRALQADEPRYTPEERLKQLRVGVFAADTPRGTLPLDLYVASMAGRQLQTPLVV